jgi:hypothetical protein
MFQQVLVDGRLRRLVVFHRRSTASWGGVIALVALGTAIIAGSIRGWSAIAHFGGSSDGTAGALVALALLCGVAVFIQRTFKRPISVGFNPEGIYAPAHGWIAWRQVRRIEVRRRGNILTGARTVVWVAFVPDIASDAVVDPGAPGPAIAAEARWLAFSPGWSQARTVELSEEMERLWLTPAGSAESGEAAGPPDPAQVAPEA